MVNEQRHPPKPVPNDDSDSTPTRESFEKSNPETAIRRLAMPYCCCFVVVAGTTFSDWIRVVSVLVGVADSGATVGVVVLVETTVVDFSIVVVVVVVLPATMMVLVVHCRNKSDTCRHRERRNDTHHHHHDGCLVVVVVEKCGSPNEQFRIHDANDHCVSWSIASLDQSFVGPLRSIHVSWKTIHGESRPSFGIAQSPPTRLACHSPCWGQMPLPCCAAMPPGLPKRRVATERVPVSTESWLMV